MEGISAEELKNQGNDALKQGNAEQAVTLYSQSIGNLS
jgi:outer membrane protein assembly factor BamD (BamD/ComL family)